MNRIPKVRSGLLTHELDGQVLVYDERGDRVHLLDATTGLVLRLLQDGGWTREGMAIEVSTRLNAPSDVSLVDLAFDQLAHSDLLEQVESGVILSDVTRREALRRLGMTGAAALLIPAISTLTANPAYAQTGGIEGAACTQNSQCASNTCCLTTNSCRRTASTCLANGNVGCTASTQCCSCSCHTNGNCVS